MNPAPGYYSARKWSKYHTKTELLSYLLSAQLWFSRRQGHR